MRSAVTRSVQMEFANPIDAGAGAPVVLLHGFPEINYAWRNQIPVPGELYRIHPPDLRGYGETDKPADGYDKAHPCGLHHGE